MSCSLKDKEKTLLNILKQHNYENFCYKNDDELRAHGMPDYRRIRRLGPGPQSFSGRQHQQQKPDGSCLTFKQHRGSGGNTKHKH
jgi:hypothetical protein